jgi:hypothetical protein
LSMMLGMAMRRLTGLAMGPSTSRRRPSVAGEEAVEVT